MCPWGSLPWRYFVVHRRRTVGRCRYLADLRSCRVVSCRRRRECCDETGSGSRRRSWRPREAGSVAFARRTVCPCRIPTVADCSCMGPLQAVLQAGAPRYVPNYCRRPRRRRTLIPTDRSPCSAFAPQLVGPSLKLL